MRRASEPAFEAFVRASTPRLLRTAVLMTGDRGHAEDLLQMTFERLARRFDPQDTELFALARVVLINLARDRRRAHRRRASEVPLDQLSDGREDASIEHLPERDALLSALAKLPDGRRAVLVLRFYEDLPVHEVAEILGISAGTVKSQTHHGLLALRREVNRSEGAHARSPG